MWIRACGGVLKRGAAAGLLLWLSACSLVNYRPVATISQVDTSRGYRLEQSMAQQNDDAYVVLLFSGGGTRAAALGYGVLEELAKQPVRIGGQDKTLLDSVDLVYGVSGGSVLATYYSLHGRDTIPAFEQQFLKQNFQKQVSRQIFSLGNLPRLTSPEFGRGDLLQEQFENTLFGHATFGDLAERRKGPFAVVSATDMSVGRRIDFTQEFFDMMCLNLSDLRLARAVAASSAVPMVFSPITLNNNGGNCGYTLPPRLQYALEQGGSEQQSQTRREFSQQLDLYQNSKERPYIHLLDGGLTDNLGLRSLLDATEIYPSQTLQRQMANQNVRKIIIISVNAQNQLDSDIDRSAKVPGLAAVLGAIINVPIDQNSQESLRRIRAVTDQWNSSAGNRKGHPISLHFVSLSLRDLPDSALRKNVLNISTSFYLPREDVNNLKEAARVLMRQSPDYERMLAALSKDAANEPPAAPSASTAPACANTSEALADCLKNGKPR
ncbi:patatin-like phospholipase family protein [Eikenella sp. S3360]|uniref:Patatin-like phospholipase family protein n=1 Tax=Eikenella glucosivorans TaxID=2766967 RepID=A0ABS0NBV1_9NEIS|nr:patatin-like phospholipase family protein [Eikenella glucosivorans]MBH5329763.1 patatin-like phospholipase family protein [Eikenella glucosivorans]